VLTYKYSTHPQELRFLLSPVKHEVSDKHIIYMAPEFPSLKSNVSDAVLNTWNALYNFCLNCPKDLWKAITTFRPLIWICMMQQH
jgi:hypothetical protein